MNDREIIERALKSWANYIERSDFSVKSDRPIDGNLRPEQRELILRLRELGDRARRGEFPSS